MIGETQAGPASAQTTGSRSTNPFLTAQEDADAEAHDSNRNATASTSTSTSVSTATATETYEPTSVPTPGRPLLRNGTQILVMPPTWESCSKCHGTGYKHADPEQPHESCWRMYGRRWTPDLVTCEAVVQGAMILQRPLPLTRPSAGGGGRYLPPAHPPPPPHQHGQGQAQGRAVPLGPPQVNRAQDANEANDDPEGEAPPSYEDVVRVPQSMQLPPQRTSEQGFGNPGGGAGGGIASMSPQPRPPSGPPPQQHQPWHQSHPHPHHQPPMGPFQPTSHPHSQPPWNHMQQPYQHPPIHVQPAYNNHHHTPFMFHNAPPPNALIVSPGDPRIGGRVCSRCGGRGVRDSLWWGTETCDRCCGAGRIM